MAKTSPNVALAGAGTGLGAPVACGTGALASWLMARPSVMQDQPSGPTSTELWPSRRDERHNRNRRPQQRHLVAVEDQTVTERHAQLPVSGTRQPPERK